MNISTVGEIQYNQQLYLKTSGKYWWLDHYRCSIQNVMLDMTNALQAYKTILMTVKESPLLASSPLLQSNNSVCLCVSRASALRPQRGSRIYRPVTARLPVFCLGSDAGKH